MCKLAESLADDMKGLGYLDTQLVARRALPVDGLEDSKYIYGGRAADNTGTTGALGGALLGGIFAPKGKKLMYGGLLAGGLGMAGRLLGRSQGEYEATKRHLAKKGIHLQYGGASSKVTAAAHAKYLAKKKG